MHRVVRLALIAVAAAGLVAAYGFYEARRMPVVRRATVELPGWPQGAAPMTVALVGDVHIGSIAMDAHRLLRVVTRINALRPDLVLLAGDFVAGHEPGSAARLAPALSAPLARLRAPLGRVSVLGNHDHWTGAAPVRRALMAAGIDVIDNDARRYGPLTVVGIGDRHTRHHRIGVAMAAARRLSGPHVVLSHSPDIVPDLPAHASLVVASHTHCGQIVLPILGAPAVPSNYGRRYLCGIVREGGRATIVTAGVGTSVLPIRIGAPPDLWLLTLRGVSRPRS